MNLNLDDFFILVGTIFVKKTKFNKIFRKKSCYYIMSSQIYCYVIFGYGGGGGGGDWSPG